MRVKNNIITVLFPRFSCSFFKINSYEILSLLQLFCLGRRLSSKRSTVQPLDWIKCPVKSVLYRFAGLSSRLNAAGSGIKLADDE